MNENMLQARSQDSGPYDVVHAHRAVAAEYCTFCQARGLAIIGGLPTWIAALREAGQPRTAIQRKIPAVRLFLQRATFMNPATFQASVGIVGF